MIPDFSKAKIVVFGDVVADQFLNGTIARVSREAPVFILRHDETITLPGGAANAAANAAALGAKVTLVGVIGKDEIGTELTASLEDHGIDCRSLIRAENLRTTTKVRVLAGQTYAQRQQVIRIDYENSKSLSIDIRTKLIANLADALTDADVVIFSDYGYGTSADGLMDEAQKLCTERKVMTIADSRYALQEFANATAATPNKEEVEALLNAEFTPELGEELRKNLGLKALLVTLGNKGMCLLDEGNPPLEIPVVGSDQPVDVTGAGDTVIATFAAALATGTSFAEAARIANFAGSIVVMKKGTATVTVGELAEAMQ